MYVLFIAGCMSITSDTISMDPATKIQTSKKMRYQRVGDMKISDLDIVLSDGAKIKAGGTEATGFESFLAALEASYKAGVKAGALGAGAP